MNEFNTNYPFKNNQNYLKAIASLINSSKAKYFGGGIRQATNSLKKYGDLNYTIGNSKIGKDTMILNMGLGAECPSAIMGLCELGPKKTGGSGKCYDLKATRLYPSSYVFKKISSFQWLHTTYEEYSQEVLQALGKHKKLKYIRFNEGGDFWTKDCIKKLAYISKMVSEFFPHIKIYTYTHRKDLVKYFDILPLNVTINGSGFKVHNNYFASENIKSEDKRKLARSKMVCLDDCSTCNLCKVRHGKTILQSIH